MVYGGVFVDYFDVVLMEFGDVFVGVVVGGFDDVDFCFDDGCVIFGIGYWFLCW